MFHGKFMPVNLAVFIFFSGLTFQQTDSVVKWTEKDDARRIEQIKKDERRLYEQQMGMKVFSSMYTSQESTNKFTDYDQNIANHVKSTSSLPEEANKNALNIKYEAKKLSDRFSNQTVLRREKNWCFSCASPLNSVSDEMQKVIRNLLEVRRAFYPFEAVMNDCTNPKSLDKLSRQECQYSFCQSLVLTDHNLGSAFTLRGCAEYLGAVDLRLLKKRADNSCKKLHQFVDIQECICEKRKYCYSGPERSFASKFSKMEDWTGRLINFSEAQADALTFNSSTKATLSKLCFALLLCIYYIQQLKECLFIC